MVTEIIHPSEELLRGSATNNQEKLIVWQQCCRSAEEALLQKAKLISSAERNTMWSRDADVALACRPYVKDDCCLDFG
jgi:hypothetical protein